MKNEMIKKRYVVSACLAGEACRYDGKANLCPAVRELVRSGQAIPVCPEVLGGLPIPRIPAEIRENRVLAKDGTDVTEAFVRGAEAALRLAQEAGCSKAILKARSPSCGSGTIYDGSFSGVRIPGEGVFARMAREAGLLVCTEEEVPGEVREDAAEALSKNPD